MKLWEQPWDEFFAQLALYRMLSPPARKALAEVVKTSGYTPIADIAEVADELAENRFVKVGSRAVSLNEWHREFAKMLRSTSRHDVLGDPGHQSFVRYLHEHFSIVERAQLAGPQITPAGTAEHLYRRVRELNWIEAFLANQNGSRIKDSLDLVIRRLMELGKPVVLASLPDIFPGVAAQDWKPLLQSALFQLALFPGLDGKTNDVLIGAWPELAGAGKAVPAPPPSQPAVTFQTPLLIEDMTALLVACASDPPKLRSGDSRLYSNAIKSIAPSMTPVPEWLKEITRYGLEGRLSVAHNRCSELGLVKAGGDYNDMRCEITERGRRWLSLGLAQRTQSVWDAVLGHTSAHMPELKVPYKESLLNNYVIVNSVFGRRADFTDEVLALFRDLPDGVWHSLEELLAHWRAMRNPFLEIYRKDPNARFAISYSYSLGNTADRLEADWQKVVAGFMESRLFPFGGLAFGLNSAGQKLITVTAAGRYLLGQAEEFALDELPGGRILVQPNFEIMFLGPAPGVEAELGRFAERRGRGVGVLFQVTRKSIYAAASQGMSAADVIGTLDRATSSSVPDNVRREIRGWFGQTRRVRFEPVVLIHCQDAETAARVTAIAKGLVKPVTDRILKFEDARNQAPLMRKLRESGMLVDTGRETESE